MPKLWDVAGEIAKEITIEYPRAFMSDDVDMVQEIIYKKLTE